MKLIWKHLFQRLTRTGQGGSWVLLRERKILLIIDSCRVMVMESSFDRTNCHYSPGWMAFLKTPWTKQQLSLNCLNDSSLLPNARYQLYYFEWFKIAMGSYRTRRSWFCSPAPTYPRQYKSQCPFSIINCRDSGIQTDNKHIGKEVRSQRRGCEDYNTGTATKRDNHLLISNVWEWADH